VANPAVDATGTLVTFSGPRGQRVPVSLYKITSELKASKPFVTSLINPSGLPWTGPAICLCLAATTARFIGHARKAARKQ